MNHCDNSTSRKGTALFFELGTFEGFNFRNLSAIERTLTAQEVVGWDHDRQGEAEFWPSGDHPGVSLVFEGRNTVTASELVALDRLLKNLGWDRIEAFLSIHHALAFHSCNVVDLTVSQLTDDPPHIFIGSSFIDLRKRAAYELFEMYHHEAFALMEWNRCDGLIFDTDRFLDSPSWSVEEVTIGDAKAIIVAPQ